MTPDPKISPVYSFRARIFIFLILFSFLSILGVGLMWASQERISASTVRITEVLMPARRMIEATKTELNLQIQELSLLASLGPQFRPGAENLAQVRLTPSVRALMSLHTSQLMPQVLRPIFAPWMQAAKLYQSQMSEFKTMNDAIRALRDLRQKTELLHRAIDREFSVQLLSLADTSKRDLAIWAAAFLIGLLGIMGFGNLVWRWMKPLTEMQQWLAQDSARGDPPRSVLGRGLLAPPSDVQALIEALRVHRLRFREQAVELETRSNKNEETERSMGTLFAALQYLMRHNQELIQELIKKERLASMSEMAAELAHEIRNPLNSMNLKLELLRDEMTPDQQTVLDKVLTEVDRLDALTESHLRTTRAHLNQARLTNLTEAVQSTLEMLKPELEAEDIRFEFLVPEIPIFSSLPETILKAALINLIKNGREALIDTPEKRITLQITKTDHAWSLHIKDNGCGFPQEFLHAPLESFRTTKATGSGLGLVTAQKMMSAYGVKLEIASPSENYATIVSLIGAL